MDRVRVRFDLFVNAYGPNQSSEVIVQAWSELLESIERDPWVSPVDAAAAAVLVGRYPWCLAEAGRLMLEGQCSTEQWVKIADHAPEGWAAGPLAVAAAGWQRWGHCPQAAQASSRALSAVCPGPRSVEPVSRQWEQVARALIRYADAESTVGQCLDSLSPFRVPVGGDL